MEMVNDKNGYRIPGFAPTLGKQYASGSLTVTTVEGALLGQDVTITINGIAVSYTAGTGIIFIPGVTYTLSNSVNCHVMK